LVLGFKEFYSLVVRDEHETGEGKQSADQEQRKNPLGDFAA
jgi:hypothetical protein